MSREEQRKRFIARIDEPHKNWKFSVGDVKEREHWDEYMKAYELCLGATSTADSPWYTVPADDKENARLIISQVVLEAFKGMNLEYPVTTPARRRELKAIRKML
jgi:polyphosphate kinase 2 (PPK2 family)